MSKVAVIRTAIVAALASVPDLGRVHDRERYVRDTTKLQELYVHTLPDGAKQLRGWWLRRSLTEERDINIARTLNVHTWTVRGYMALDDEGGSELVFDELIEAIRDAVRADPTFGGVCQVGPIASRSDSSKDSDTNGVQVSEVGPVNFCGVLCHSAVLQLQTWSYS